jgi:vancomycin resistance protein VanJ
MLMDAPTTDPSTATDARPKAGAWERVVRRLLWFGWLSAVLHFWPKDRWVGLSLWFYGTPWGAILALSVFTVIVALLRQQTRSSRLLCGALALLILTGGMWLATDWDWRGDASDADATTKDARPIRLLIWNTSRGRGGWENVAAEIRKHDPDVICLVEAGAYSAEMRAMWEAFFPEHKVSMLGGSIVCIVRGTAGECTPVDLTPDSGLRLLPVEVRGQSFHCAIVDIESSIFNVRQRPLMRLADSLDDVAGPIIVAGDFNTPSDSVHFARLNENYSSAWNEIGHSYSGTWPVPLPLMDLDQVWYNESVAMRSFNLGWSSASDHRPVIVAFVVK